MNKYITILIVALMLLATVPAEAKTQVSSQLIWAEYDHFQSFGTRAYLITWDDGTTSIEFSKGSLASLATIWGSGCSNLGAPEADIISFDNNPKDGLISKAEAATATTMYFAGAASKATAVAVTNFYLTGCSFNAPAVAPTQTPTPTPTATTPPYVAPTTSPTSTPYRPETVYEVGDCVLINGRQVKVTAIESNVRVYPQLVYYDGGSFNSRNIETVPPIQTCTKSTPTPTPTPTVTSSTQTQSYTTPTPTSTPYSTSTPTITSITFSTSTTNGNKITVPLNSIVTAHISLSGSGSGEVTIQVKKDIESTIDAIHSQTNKIMTLPALIDYEFDTPDLTGSNNFREYFLKIYYNGNTIYDPTNPSTREGVSTYSTYSLSEQPIPTQATPTPTPVTNVPSVTPSQTSSTTSGTGSSGYVAPTTTSVSTPSPTPTTTPGQNVNTTGIGIVALIILIVIVISFKKKR